VHAPPSGPEIEPLPAPSDRLPLLQRRRQKRWWLVVPLRQMTPRLLPQRQKKPRLPPQRQLQPQQMPALTRNRPHQP